MKAEHLLDDRTERHLYERVRQRWVQRGEVMYSKEDLRGLFWRVEFQATCIPVCVGPPFAFQSTYPSNHVTRVPNDERGLTRQFGRTGCSKS